MKPEYEKTLIAEQCWPTASAKNEQLCMSSSLETIIWETENEVKRTPSHLNCTFILWYTV